MKKVIELFKKFYKELSVFALVLVVFLCLFAYRNATYKTYKTINESKLTSWVEKDKDFVLVVGDSTETDTVSYQETMTTYCTKNRSTNLYFIDASTDEDFDDYLEGLLDVSVQKPTTLIIKDGEVVAKKEGNIAYYNLVDLIKENK